MSPEPECVVTEEDLSDVAVIRASEPGVTVDIQEMAPEFGGVM
jgi:hypothetical protein